MDATLPASSSPLCAVCQVFFSSGLRKIYFPHITTAKSVPNKHAGPIYWSELNVTIGRLNSEQLKADFVWPTKLEPPLLADNGFVQCPSVFYLENAGATGCPICLQGWRASQRQSPLVESFFWVGTRIAESSISGQWILQYLVAPDHPYAEAGKGATTIDLSISPVQTLGRDAILSRKDCQPRTDSKNSFDLCRAWIDQCLKNHTSNCGLERSYKGTLPTRLIDTSIDPPRLVLAEQLTPGTRYATLSHRWGEAKIYKLVKDRLEQFRKGLPLTDLPKTFLEAFWFVRNVFHAYNVKHLWIDSLCILQDSQDDWSHEASMMGNIYGNAFCNIAATSTTSDSLELFHERDMSLLQSARISIWDAATSRGKEYIMTERDRWMHHVLGGPLNSRAWVYQERLLSARTIHFCKNELYWQCHDKRASETFPEGEPEHDKHDIDSLVRIATWLKHYIETVAPDHDLPPAFRQHWTRTVDEFSRSKLTYPDDRLPAFSGISEVFQTFFHGSEYCAGLWRYQLERQLLWRTDMLAKLPMYQPMSASVLGFKSPSWSWSSVNVAVQHEWIDDPQLFIDLLGIDIIPAGSSVFGKILSGHLRMRCILIPGTVKLLTDEDETIQSTEQLEEESMIICTGDREADEQEIGDQGTGDQEISRQRSHVTNTKSSLFSLERHHVDGGFNIKLNTRQNPEKAPTFEPIFKSYGSFESQQMMQSAFGSFDVSFHRNQTLEGEICFVPISLQEWGGRGNRCGGLVVESTGRKVGEYRRLGIYWHFEEYSYDILRGKIGTVAREVPPKEFEEDCGDGEYIISIV